MEKQTLDNVTALILAGGQGTRLRSVISDRPKPMAGIRTHQGKEEKPFLSFLMTYLAKQGIKHIVLSISHMAQQIAEFYSDERELLHLANLGISLDFCYEKKPLGTGGALKFAMDDEDLFSLCAPNVLVLNGDSFFNSNLAAFYDFHLNAPLSNFSLNLKEMPSIDRYGQVVLEGQKVEFFKEKDPSFQGSGLINSGVYFLNRSYYLAASKKLERDHFSLEKDFFPLALEEGMYADVRSKDEYFIDIGIPEDYFRSQEELQSFL